MATDWNEIITEDRAHIADFRGHQTRVMDAFGALNKAVAEPGALSVKQKELMALAIGIAKQCVDCIAFHTKAAIEAGATRDEIAETVSVSVLMGGGPALMYGTKALEAYDQLAG